jgi:hypothetical protein
MPNFKPKNTKQIKITKKNAVTIDGKHREFLNEFDKDENEEIPKLIEKKELLKKKLEKSNSSLEEQLDMIDQLKNIKMEIKNIKSKKKEYFLDNSKYIFDYFENKKDISTGKDSMNNTVTTKNKAIEKIFKIKREDPTLTDETKEEHEKQSNPFYNGGNNVLNNSVQKYFNNVDESFIDMNSFVYPTDICQYCYKGELIPLEDDGLLICNMCSRTIPYLIENEKPSYKEPPKEICFYAYKRINHFKEILAQFQGKETTQIPPEVIENIKLQIKKERIQLDQITNVKTKEILKKLGYNKYYEHIPFIKDKLGIKPPVMSQELEETLCNIFIELQAPYSKFCPDDRVNFLNYYYTAYKLCELLDEKYYLPHFPMLKDRDKIVEQDVIWKKICKELDWEFITTI